MKQGKGGREGGRKNETGKRRAGGIYAEGRRKEERREVKNGERRRKEGK